MSVVFATLVIAVWFVLIGYIIQRELSANPISFPQNEHAAAKGQTTSSLDTYPQPVVPPHPNAEHLHAVRSRSCYPVLRVANAMLTALAAAATVVLWLVLLYIADNTLEGTNASLMCGAVIVALLIQYGLFRLIVDAVDVLIDSSRRTQERDGGGAAE